MANNPTVIVGSLNDKELKEAIDKLVGHVEQGTKKMTDSFDSAVEHIKNSLKSLGDTKIDLNLGNSSGSKSGDSNGSKARSQSQKAETKAVEDTAAAYDKLVGALQYAQRAAKLYGSKGMDDKRAYQEYVAALERIAELTEHISVVRNKLAVDKNMAAATANEGQWAFDPKRMLSGFDAVDDRLTKLNKQYKDLENQSRKTFQESFTKALKMPTTNIDEVKAKISEIRQIWHEGGKTEFLSQSQLNKAWETLKQLLKTLQDLEDKAAQSAQAAHTAKVTSEYEKQKELIDHIASRKDATKAFEKISLMPSGTMEEMQHKGKLLQDLIKKVKDTPLMSVTNVNLAKKMLNDIVARYSELKAAAERAARATTESAEKAKISETDRARATAEALERDKKAQEEAIAKETERRAELVRTAQAAQAAAPQLREAIASQLQSADYTKPIEGQKELVKLVGQMTQALRELRRSGEQPILADALSKDLQEARALLQVVQRYNLLVSGLGSIGQNLPKDTYIEYQNELNRLVGIFHNLSSAERDAAAGRGLIEKVQELGRETKKIQQQLSRPVSLASAFLLPSNTLEEISYRIQRLRSYAQGINTETAEGKNELQFVNDLVEKLNGKAKDLQRTTSQIQSDLNSKNFANISQMPAESLQQVGRKIAEIKQFIGNLKGAAIVDEKNLKRAESLLDSLIKKADKLNKTQGTKANVNEALKMQANTLNEIAEKTQRLQAIRANLNPQGQAQLIQKVNDALRDLGKRQDEIIGKTIKLASSGDTFTRAWAYMKNRLAFYLTVGATTSFVKQLVEVRGQYELTERALGVLIDSAEKGSQIFKELSDMALVSPYTLIELSQAARMLTAYGVTASNVVDTTRRLADISAAVGAPINNIAYALGHVQSYGYLTTLQARQFANVGIPLVKALAEEYTKLEGKMVSVTDVYARMKHKQVSYADVMQVVNSMTDEGGRFFDFQAKTADTLKVQLANLTLAWNNMLNEMGESYQWLIELPIKGLKSLFLAWESISGIVNQVVIGFGLYKAAQLVMNAAIGISYRSLNKQALATKKAAAAQLRKEAVTRNLSAAEKEIIANSRVATIEDYKRELSTRKLTASQAKLLVANNKKNTALHKAIIQTGLLKKTEVQAALATNVWSLRLTVLGERLKMARVAMKEFMSSNWIMLLLGVLTEVGVAIYQNIQEQKEFNEGIANGAKEAAKSFKDFYYSFKKGTTTAELQKSWEALREQILTNSAAGEIFVEQLSKTEDVAKRVGDALDYTKRIQEVSEAMSTLTDELNVHAGAVWWQGEEGLDEDLQDYQEKFDKIARKIKEGGFESVADAITLDDYFKEAEKEVKKFAKKAHEQLKNVLTPEDMEDPVKVREALSRIEAEILKKYPKIKGVGKQMFLLETDKIFEEETGGVIKQSETIQNQILELLKQTNASAFSTLTDASEALNNEQLKAINRTIEEYKSRVPSEWHALIDELASQDWLIPVKAKMEVTPMDPAQKESYMHFIGDTEKEAADIREEYSKHSFEATMAYLKAGWGKTLTEEEERMLLLYDKNEAAQSKLNKARQTYTTLLRKQGESILDYEERLTKQREKAVDMLAREKLIMATLTDTSRERYIQAKTEKEKLQEAIDALDAVAEYEGLNILGKQKKGSKKDILGDAFSKEVQYISDIQKRIKEYRKMGVDAQTAQAKATEEYGKSISNNNEILKKYKVQTLSADKLTNMSLQDIRDFYKEQVKVAQQLKNTKGVEALEKAIASLNVEITKLDYKRIVDGLNQELSKIKDEYELAIELSANPELGDMFTSMFGIDTDTLPRTFKEAYDRANKVAIDALKELKVEVANFDLMSAAFVGDEENKWHGLELDSDPMKELIKDQKTWRDMYKKNLTETEKALDDYVEKYGGEEDKMAQIEADRLEKLRKLDDAYYTEGMRKRAEYIAKLDAINKGAQKEQASVRFDSFKNSDLYVQMFENLDYISTSTLKRMREKLEELKTSMGELKPEQLKQIVQQIEKLDQQLSERTEPFSNLGKNALNYIKLLKERSKVEKQATEKQSEVDKQQKVVNLLEQQHEQLKRKEGVTKKELDYSNGNLTIQKGILKALKEALAPLLEKLGLIKYANEALHNALNQTSQWLGVAKDLNSTIMDVADSLGASEATKEVLSDIGAMLEGIDQVVQGFDDLISLNPVKMVGGVVKIFGGIWKSIATWFDNSNKKIDRQIQDSEKHVKKLEQAYNSLEHTIEKAMGTAETSARRAAIANKKLQLEELKTQLVLERSRKSKYQDEEKIMDLEGRITDLTNDINDMIDDVASNLAGSDIKSAAESFVDAWVDAWKEGETTLDAIEEKMDEMIFNIIKKSASAAIVGKLLQPFYDALDEYTSAASEGGEELTTGELKKLGTLASKLGIDINEALGAFYGNLEGLDIISKNIKDKDLSQLQQGIQSITEDTAGALEAYMNGVSQQVYLQSDLLTEIRNAVATMDNDAQLGTQAQMLLQLQQSYAVQVAIRNIMEGWTNASGMAVRVEMI